MPAQLSDSQPSNLLSDLHHVQEIIDDLNKFSDDTCLSQSYIRDIKILYTKIIKRRVFTKALVALVDYKDEVNSRIQDCETVEDMKELNQEFLSLATVLKL